MLWKSAGGAAHTKPVEAVGPADQLVVCQQAFDMQRNMVAIVALKMRKAARMADVAKSSSSDSTSQHDPTPGFIMCRGKWTERWCGRR